MKTKKNFIHSNSHHGFASIQIACILLLCTIVLCTSMSFWSLLKIKITVSEKHKLLNAYWLIEDSAKRYQENVLIQKPSQNSSCSTLKKINTSTDIVTCKHESAPFTKNFIIVTNDE